MSEDQDDQDQAPKIGGDMETLFILDLFKQRKEKINRLKKDEMIHEMALKQKKQIEEAKRAREPQRVHSPHFCGFVGVQNLMSGSPSTSRKWNSAKKI